MHGNLACRCDGWQAELLAVREIMDIASLAR
jgi:hypothetical protein